MKKVLLIGVGIAVAVVVLRHSTFGTRLRESMAQHEVALRDALLPDEETLARARETRATRRGRHAASGPDTEPDETVVFPEDGTDYF